MKEEKKELFDKLEKVGKLLQHGARKKIAQTIGVSEMTIYGAFSRAPYISVKTLEAILREAHLQIQSAAKEESERLERAKERIDRTLREAAEIL